ncbi:probable calcium-binding protein CML18 [Eurytemora carolleeae]|uniref:probable calcium-binding protein CML18 n=1 Tax=Eurytemora carolleeae TaxID=1294199 RepID=UPI000C7762A7|nr:probable calcium-binding protein CML18 [Eurytemora carolleeae]|eukprot:XP_023341366.1 probable calcium-binding protein CML18 [Eurytemora affinis]
MSLMEYRTEGGRSAYHWSEEEPVGLGQRGMRMAAHSVLYQLHKKLNEKKDKEALEEAFRKADLNGDGRLTVEEIFAIFKDHEVPVSIEEIREVVMAADKDGTGQLTVQEFSNSPKAVETVQEGRGEDANKKEVTKSPAPQR